MARQYTIHNTQDTIRNTSFVRYGTHKARELHANWPSFFREVKWRLRAVKNILQLIHCVLILFCNISAICQWSRRHFLQFYFSGSIEKIVSEMLKLLCKWRRCDNSYNFLIISISFFNQSSLDIVLELRNNFAIMFFAFYFKIVRKKIQY